MLRWWKMKSICLSYYAAQLGYWYGIRYSNLATRVARSVRKFLPKGRPN